jgi:RNA polymerase sigma-70 factor, ECF subfamily
MPKEKPPSSNETLRRIELAAAGDQNALGQLLEQYRDRLTRMVALRLDARLHGLIDASHVIREGFLDASRRLADYARDPSTPFYIWLRFLIGQRIVEIHRRHLGGQALHAGREVSLYRGCMPEASTAALAAQLLGKLTSPSQTAVRAERKIRLQEALNTMDSIDREILILRHYERMTNGEAAIVLSLDKSAASKRYTRALLRLKEILSALPVRHSEDER